MLKARLGKEVVLRIENDEYAFLLKKAESNAKNLKSKFERMKMMSRDLVSAEEFEAVFLSQMLEPMFKGIETDGMFGGGSSEKIYQSVMLQEYGKALARAGGVGIADAVEREILRLQEVQQP